MTLPASDGLVVAINSDIDQPAGTKKARQMTAGLVVWSEIANTIQ